MEVPVLVDRFVERRQKWNRLDRPELDHVGDEEGRTAIMRRRRQRNVAISWLRRLRQHRLPRDRWKGHDPHVARGRDERHPLNGWDAGGQDYPELISVARHVEQYWARYGDGVRVDGPAVNAPADVPGAAEALERPPVYPSVAGLVRAVTDWTAAPAPLIPLYLRRPDAKPSVVTTR